MLERIIVASVALFCSLEATFAGQNNVPPNQLSSALRSPPSQVPYGGPPVFTLPSNPFQIQPPHNARSNGQRPPWARVPSSRPMSGPPPIFPATSMKGLPPGPSTGVTTTVHIHKQPKEPPSED